MYQWAGAAILVMQVGSSFLGNLQQKVLTLSESNAVSDASSLISVVEDV